MKTLVGESATVALATKFASLCQPPLVIYLQGDLGSGKTTFARGLITALGHSGNVKSPTFSLVEIYDLGEMRLYHFDLYRLKDPLELEYIGIRDLVGDKEVVCLIEWPERGGQEVPPADLIIQLEYQGELRKAAWYAESTQGQAIIEKL